VEDSFVDSVESNIKSARDGLAAANIDNQTFDSLAFIDWLGLNNHTTPSPLPARIRRSRFACIGLMTGSFLII
jgi:hypothetical protein